MTGPDYDEDGPDEFRPVPHPDDRLWRHPSEIAAIQAAHANAETVKVPVVRIADDPSRSRLQVGLMVAAGVVVVGAAALTIGVISATSTDTRLDEVAAIIPVSNTNLVTNFDTVFSTDAQAGFAASLPRIQAVTPNGMREGGGLFVTDDGYIATSAGLIDNAEYVLAWTEDGQRWKAEVIASDPASDVAVVHIDSADWPAAALGSGAMWNGQDAHALNHDDLSISVGEITSVSAPLVEIDQPAALPGSAIFDDSGAVIAMVTADGTNRHATPAWMLEQVAIDLITSGSTTHVWLGLVVGNVATGDMVTVEQVAAGSPAAQAGLRTGDLIDSFNGTPVSSAASLHREVQHAEPGDEAVLTVTRNASRRLIIATLGVLPD